MSNEIVPYAIMEKMAATVAKSGLFGMKTTEQALALMALSQAEGIHPMTAVRDYHIVAGKPSLKADTMLARFQQAGGMVEWHTLSDTKAEATFSPPKGNPLKMDWTIERATKAGLAAKDTWKAYPRAMLRSRLISEAVRTLLPSVLSGAYTPEEAESIDPEAPTKAERLESFEHPGLPNEIAQNFVRSISEAPDLGSLKVNFGNAYSAAKVRGDELRMSSFKTAYDARKGELEQPALTLAEDAPPSEQI